MILCINGSPKPDSNVRRMIDTIGKGTGMEYTIVDLAQLTIQPCTGCVKCGATNRCVQRDDMAPLYDKIVDAEALVVGGVTYFAHPNAFTRTFLERMFPLRHRLPQTPCLLPSSPSPAVAANLAGKTLARRVLRSCPVDS